MSFLWKKILVYTCLATTTLSMLHSNKHTSRVHYLNTPWFFKTNQYITQYTVEATKNYRLINNGSRMKLADIIQNTADSLAAAKSRRRGGHLCAFHDVISDVTVTSQMTSSVMTSSVMSLMTSFPLPVEGISDQFN